MKFLIIASSPSSILNFRGKLLEAISNADIEVHIAAPNFNNNSDELTKLSNLGYTVHNIPLQRTGTNPLSDINTLKSLYLIIRDIKPQYVLSYTIKPVIYGTLAAWLNRVPNRFALITGLGYTFQNVEETGKRSKFQKIIHEMYRQSLSKAHHVFFQNPDDEALFKSMGILTPNASTTVVNGSGVDISEYSVQPFATIDDILIPRFLLIARLLGDKGVREYAQAARIVKEKYPQAQFDLVGWIDDNPDAIEKKELDNWINEGLFNFWGKLADVKPAIAASSIYVLPSYREGTPRTVLEAMAMGRPIITTDAPGCRETVMDGYNGYLVPVKAVEELAAAMERFIVNPALITEMGKASRQLVEEKFDVDAVNQSMLEAIGL